MVVVNNKTPESLRGSARAIITVRYKDNKIILSKLQKEFFVTLSNGEKHSSYRLMQQLKASDPRKEVQYLRNKGINVQYEWIKGSGKYARHKLYFIDSKECGKGVNYE